MIYLRGLESSYLRNRFLRTAAYPARVHCYDFEKVGYQVQTVYNRVTVEYKIFAAPPGVKYVHVFWDADHMDRGFQRFTFREGKARRDDNDLWDLRGEFTRTLPKVTEPDHAAYAYQPAHRGANRRLWSWPRLHAHARAFRASATERSRAVKELVIARSSHRLQPTIGRDSRGCTRARVGPDPHLGTTGHVRRMGKPATVVRKRAQTIGALCLNHGARFALAMDRNRHNVARGPAPSLDPIVNSIMQNTVKAGMPPIDVTIAGSNFVAGATVTFEKGIGGPPKASTVVVVDANTITATLTVKKGGPPVDRVWDVVVTNPDLRSGRQVGGFTVNP